MFTRTALGVLLVAGLAAPRPGLGPVALGSGVEPAPPASRTPSGPAGGAGAADGGGGSAGAERGCPVSVEIANRPFAVDVDTLHQHMDGIFDTFIGEQLIGVYLLNSSGCAMENVTATASVDPAGGCVLLEASADYGTLTPGVPVLRFFRGDFTNAAVDKHQLTVNVSSDQGDATVARYMFVARSEHDPVDVNTWTMYCPEGSITTTVVNNWGGSDLASIGFIDDLVWTVNYNEPFAGQFGPLPWNDPWWKAFGLGFGLGGCAGWIVGAVAEGCGANWGKTVKEVGQAEKGAGALGVAADFADPFRRGQEATPVPPDVVTYQEQVVLNSEFHQQPRIGQFWTADVQWTYTRFTNVGPIQHTISEVRAQDIHYSTNRQVEVELFNPGSDPFYWHYVIRASAQGPAPLNGNNAYWVADMFAAGDDRLHDVLATVVLTDDGAAPGDVPMDGVYSGVLPVTAIPPGVTLAGYVFGFDMNNAPEGIPPEIAAQEIGGALISAPELGQCSITADIFIEPLDLCPITTYFAGLPLEHCTDVQVLVIDDDSVEIYDLDAATRSTVDIPLGGDADGWVLGGGIRPEDVPFGGILEITADFAAGPASDRIGVGFERTSDATVSIRPWMPSDYAEARIVCLNNGAVVFTGDENTSVEMQVTPGEPAGDLAIFTASTSFGTTITVCIDLPVPIITWVNGIQVTITRVYVEVDIWTPFSIGLGAGRIEMDGIDRLTFGGQTLLDLGAAIAAIGGARMQAASDGLVVSNIGASGTDGVNAALHTEPGYAICGSFSPRDWAVDSFFDITYRLEMSDGSEGLAGIRFGPQTGAGQSDPLPMESFSLNFASSGMDVELLLFGASVGSAVNFEDIFCSAAPSCYVCVQSSENDATPRFEKRFDAPVTVTLPDGTQVLADCIALTPITDAEMLGVRGMTLTGRDLPEMLITAIEPVVPLPAPRCPGDYNGDGVVNTADFFEFFADFFASPPDADYNNDGATNTSDFFEFFADFFSAQPCD